MLDRKHKEEEESKGSIWSGLGLLVMAAVVAYLPLSQRVPDFENLAVSEAVVTKAPYMDKRFLTTLDRIDYYLAVLSLDGETAQEFFYPAVGLDGRRSWIATGLGSRGISRELQALPMGARIKTWTWTFRGEPYLWQVEHKGRTLLPYGDIVKRDRPHRLIYFAIAIGILVFGMGMLVRRLLQP